MKRFLLTGSLALSLMYVAIGAAQDTGGSKPSDKKLARQAVEKALKIEAAGGEDAARQAALQEALTIDKNFAPARSIRGEIFDNGKWLTIEEAAAKRGNHPYLRGYEKKRRETRDTEEGNWEVAAWCEQHSLWLQKYAHLCRVLELNPKNIPARMALGWRQTEYGWISPEQVTADLRFENEAKYSVLKFGNKIDEIIRNLKSPNEGVVARGADDLAKLTDPAAVIAIEQMMSSKSESLANQAIDKISSIPQPAATRSLLRHALYHPNAKVRGHGSEQLVKREAQGWAPALLALIRSEIALELRPDFSTTGDLIGLRHVFSQENRTSNDTLINDHAYLQFVNQHLVGTANRDGFSSRVWDSSQANFIEFDQVQTTIFATLLSISNHNEKIDQQLRIAQHAKQTTMSTASAVAQYNATAEIINSRAFQIIDRYANKKVGDKPTEYWDWWQAEKKWGNSSYRPKNVVYQQTGTASYRDYHGYRLTPITKICLVGSTIVSLQQGPKPIKQVRIGDLVYCKNVESGGIQIAPVTGVTESKELTKLLAIRVGNETIECSEGHEFFISGKGWMKACDMKAGDFLHAAEGPIRIESIAESGKAPVYNLVVANYSNYFVGEGKILSHDLTERAENYYLVPGLAPETK